MIMVGEGRFDFDIERGYYGDDYELKVSYYFDRVENEKEKDAREKAEAMIKAKRCRKAQKGC